MDEQIDLSLETSIKARLSALDGMTPEERRQRWEDARKIREAEEKALAAAEAERSVKRSLELEEARLRFKNRVPGDLNIRDTKAAISVRLELTADQGDQMELPGMETSAPTPPNFTNQGGISWDSNEKMDFCVQVFMKFGEARNWLYYDFKNKFGWDVWGPSTKVMLTYVFGDQEAIRGLSPADVKSKIMSLSGAKYMPYVKDFYLCWPIQRHAALRPAVSPEALAEKHDVSLAEIIRKLDKGQKVEREHTGSNKEARQIASHHIEEFLNYYEELGIMEKKLKKSERK